MWNFSDFIGLDVLGWASSICKVSSWGWNTQMRSRSSPPSFCRCLHRCGMPCCPCLSVGAHNKCDNSTSGRRVFSLWQWLVVHDLPPPACHNTLSSCLGLTPLSARGTDASGVSTVSLRSLMRSHYARSAQVMLAQTIAITVTRNSVKVFWS